MYHHGAAAGLVLRMALSCQAAVTSKMKDEVAVTLFRPARRRTRAMTGAPRVGLVGLLGQGNLGNDGSLEAVLAYLGTEHSDAILDFLCSGTEQMTARYGVPATRLRWYNTETKGAPGTVALAAKSLKVPLGMVIDAFRTASWVSRHDVVIVPGMGVLEATLPLRPWHTPYSMFLVCAFGRLFGTKVALVSVGANDIGQRLTRRLITAAAGLAYYRSYRDTFSRDAMRRMGLDTSRDAVYPDLVFALPTPRAAVVAGAVGVGVMDYHGGNDDRQWADQLHASYVEKMKSLVLWLVDSGRPVRLFTTDVHDKRIMREVIDDLRAHRPELGPSQVIAEPVSSLDELMRQIASVEIVVASRYHNVLCALKLAKPTLSVGYAAKFSALMAEMGLAEFCQSARSLDIDRLIEQFTDLESRSAQLRQTMTERTAANEQLLKHQFATLSSLLFRATEPARTAAGHEASSHRCSSTGVVMNNAAGGENLVSEDIIGTTLHKKDFWSKENLKYTQPHYRLEKSARIINRLAQSRRRTLLDVGCGPATLASLLRPNIQYYGIDIAIHDPAPNLIEADFLETPIGFDDKHFDIILAQGVFEYVGNLQAQKFAEIARLLNDGGIFIVSYVNFDHRDSYVYPPYSNIQTFNDFHRRLAQHFKIHRFFPTSHNWNHSEPNRKLLKAANIHFNVNIPFISRVLAVEYFFICSGRI
jgi:polysaccharide pyruvyl transferase WcaK-like protein/SAM-dependent methyltransferase